MSEPFHPLSLPLLASWSWLGALLWNSHQSPGVTPTSLKPQISRFVFAHQCLHQFTRANLFFCTRADRCEMVPFEEGMFLPNCPRIAYPSLALRPQNQGGICQTPCPSNHNQRNHISIFLISLMVNLFWQHMSMGTLIWTTDVCSLWRWDQNERRQQQQPAAVHNLFMDNNS